MQREDSAKFIFALVKRCRKYYLGVTTITQDVNDFLASPYGQAIVNNSSLQLLMKQSPAAIDLIQKTFILTEGEKYLLLESGVGEGIFFAGAKHAAIKVVASYSEDQLITSDPRQLLEIEQAKKEFEEAMSQEEATATTGEAPEAPPVEKEAPKEEIAPVVEETPVEEASEAVPAEKEAPKEETAPVVEETPVEEAPVEEVPKKEAPKEPLSNKDEKIKK